MVQESHCTSPSLKTIFSQKLKPHLSFWTKHCGIIIKNSSLSPSNFTTYLEERVCSVNIIWGDNPITVLSLYAPTVCRDRQDLFESFSSLSFPNPIILAGDFNCWLNKSTDHIPHHTILPVGAKELQELLTCHDLMDSVSACQDRYLPMSRFHKSGNQVISSSRLDYIFVSSSIFSLLYNHYTDIFSASDHRVVSASLKTPAISSAPPWLKILPSSVSSWQMNLAVRKACIELSSLSQDPLASWSRFKTALIKHGKLSASQKTTSEMARVNQARRTIKHLEKNAPLSGFSLAWSSKFAAAFSIIRKHNQHQERIAQIRAGTRLTIQGDKSTRYYLSQFKIKRASSTLSEVLNPDGSLASLPCDISVATHNFYSCLYASDGTNSDAIATFLDSLPPCNQPCIPIMHPISLKELMMVIKQLPKRKSPGPDGIPYEVYSRFSKSLAPHLLEVFNFCLSKGLTLPGGSTAFVTTLYKKGDKRDLANWRPIALSNADSKILSKLMTSRLNQVGLTCLSSSQYGFLPGRSIFDNINLVANVLSCPKSAGSLCFLDQEKAYDRVDWSYLSACLSHYKVDPSFIQWIYKVCSSSSIQVRGPSFVTDHILPGRGLRQGDPLSPILYNFAINPLLELLNCCLQGIPCPGQPPLRVLAFADDCVLGIRDPQDSDIANSILSSFEAASQAKLNAGKSLALAKGPITLPLLRGIQYTTSPIRHLGILVSSEGIADADMEDKLLTAMSTRLSLWSLASPTLKGKCLLINTFVTSKIWYFVHSFPVSENFCRQVCSMLQQWLWPRSRAPMPLSDLCTPASQGGMGLIHPVNQANRMFGKWLFGVLNPETTSEGWQLAARSNFCLHASLSNPHYPSSMLSYLVKNPSARGPHTLCPFWKRSLKLFRDLGWKIVATRGTTRGNPIRFSCTFKDLPLLYYPLPKEETPLQVPNTARRFPLVDSISLAPLWYFASNPLILGRYTSHSWKVLMAGFFTADRDGPSHPLCPFCSSEDTLPHRYFQCSNVRPLWSMVRSVFMRWVCIGSHINWFLLDGANCLDQQYGAVMFTIALWAAHSSFVARLKNTPPIPILSLFQSLLIATYQNIYFGTGWSRRVLQYQVHSSVPWFLTVNHRTRTVTFEPLPNPACSTIHIHVPATHRDNNPLDAH